ncbi:MAG: hypothetical protein IJK41_00210 [Muribaculaceae bacterium]|nr:hypothetical protein [Muribaculaceae bacterium]
MIKRILLALVLGMSLCCGINAETGVTTSVPDVQYGVSIVMNAGDSELAPYYISSNTGGTVTQQYDALVAAGLWHALRPTERFSWGAGIEAWGGYSSDAGYERYKGYGQFEVLDQHPARGWIQQAYLEGKYRSIFAVAGQKYKDSSPIVDRELSSGDLVWSNNARPPVGLRAGFIDFQDIPFTKGWLQLTGEFGYFRQFDDKWLENHYNYYNHFITTGSWLHYKSLHFRTKPSQPVVFTIGAQSACQFGGTADYYEDGKVTRTVKMDADAKAFFRTFIAGSGGNSAGDSFVEGNHLGSWDIALEYKLKDGKRLRAYTQWLWEDGSGIGKMNGFDGLWGLEYCSHQDYSLVEGAVIEYIDFTNQSGPIHWTPNDHPDTPITSHSSGADDYYNNYIYNGYQNRGMSIGSPFVKSPLYNQDGYMRYRDNVLRGFHAAVAGWLGTDWSYRLKGSYRKAWGTPLMPRAGSIDDFSMSLEGSYHTHTGWQFRGQVAMDHGSMYGNNWGALVGIYYHGNFNLKKR